MRAVGIKILKNKLSEYVRIAAAGETVLVTDRDRVVAELVPPRPGRSPAPGDSLYAELIRKGYVTPAQTRAKGPLPRRPVAATESLLKELDEDRKDSSED
jgi:antitoxin (DNA-binding transcriptional repressor) of toxin-antitoxin stability system